MLITDQEFCTRVVPDAIQSRSAYIGYLRHLFAYDYVRNQLPASARVLEVGCGDGYGALYLAQKVAAVDALDIDSTTVQMAQEKYQQSNLQFSLFDGQVLPKIEDPIDAVVSMQVIEHVPDVPRYLKMLRSALTNGRGHLWLTTPNRTYRLHPRQKPWNPFHLREYDVASLSEEIRAEFPSAEVVGIGAIPAIADYEYARVRAAKLAGGHLGKVRVGVERILGLETRAKTIAKRRMHVDWRQYTTTDFHVLDEQPSHIDGSALDLMVHVHF